MPSILLPSPHPPLPAAKSLVDWLERRADARPAALAYRFLSDGEETEHLLTLGELREQARRRAGALVSAGATGQPVLLLEPPGLDFITGLFACWYAGAVAVPAYPPRGKRHRLRLDAIRRDSGATLALGQSPAAELPDTRMISCEESVECSELPGISADHELPCLLQYTSGSTAEPKGVVLQPGQLLHHLSAVARTVQSLSLRSALSWLPPYHDMGLILKLLLALETGMPLTFFAPDHFVQRPVRWLRAISRHRAEFSGAPNFAFELCLRAIRDEELQGLDLSCWRAAPTGAERIRVETLQRFVRRFEPYGFRPEALLPGYGLAEASLIVTACRPGRPQRISHHAGGTHVSCGTPIDDTVVRIADPESGRSLPPGEIGEIVVRGPGVASGYWKRPEASTAAFGKGELRTGDRGYLENGELHVVGRIKDLIILDGINVAPEDIESTLAAAFPEIQAVAAFACTLPEGEGVAVAIESPRAAGTAMAAWCGEIRRRLAEEMEIPLQRLVFARSGTLPRTTSGKIRRAATREAFESGRLALMFDEDAAAPAMPPLGGKTLDLVLDAVREASGRDGATAADDLISAGLSSIEATRLAALLRATTGAVLPLAELFATRSFAELAATIDSRGTAPRQEIVPGSGKGTGILTHSQERMGFLHRLEPDSAAYHVFGALDLQGPLDRGALEKAYAAVIARHPILRTRHPWVEGVQVVVPDDQPPPPLALAAGDPESLLREFALRPFDLELDPPVRGLLIEAAPDHHCFALCAHHIVADGWSVRLIARELAAWYAVFAGAAPVPPARLGPDYFDYAAWHRGWIDGGAADSQVDYWKHRLAGHPGSMDLAADFPRPAKPSSAGEAVRREVPADLGRRIAALARSRRATPFMVQLAAFLLMLRRHGGGDDPVVAVPIANRHHPDAADLVGTLVNTLPFRLSLDAAEPFVELLDRVRDAAFEMQAVQDAPFERIVEAVRPERARDRTPLAQVMFDHQELPVAENWHGGLRCSPYLAHRGAVQFDLALIWFVLADRQLAVLEFRSDLFRADTAAAMLDRYLATLDEVCREPALPVRSICGLAERDLLQLLSVGEGPVRPDFPLATAPERIAAACRRLPGATAVVCGETALSYADLDRLSSSLAAALAARGVHPGDRVALMLDRDLLLPVALLAVWKAGAAYVPLDPANPPERLALVLEDQQPIHVLASPGLLDRLPADTAAIVLEPSMTEGTAGALALPPAPADTAYILYTSGSTGRPKGVVVSHGALANFLLSMQEEPGFREGDRLLAVTTVSFDISALEIHLPLLAGGTLDLVPGRESRDPAALIRRLEETRPQVMQATPATWRMLIDAGWQGNPGMKILCGGEAMDLPLARRLLPLGQELWNLYGPTETTVWSTIWKVPPDPERILIGQPIANTGIVIAGSDGAPVPPGVPGELTISGAGLADGYWRRPDLTDTHFTQAAGAKVPRRYRTGDLARWLPDGSLECLGRADGQVKVRGFRVELGEIDAAMMSHLGIAEAAAVLAGERLVGFYRPVVSGLDPAELLEHLRARLPDYMIPAPLLPLDRMPLTASGKIDRKALATRPLPGADTPAPAAGGDPLVRELAGIWGEILGCRGVGADDDFFALGGHSLAAARLVAEVARRIGTAVPLDWLFDRPTPAGMAARMRERSAADLELPRILPLARGLGGAPLFWCHTLVDGGMGLLPYRETARRLAGKVDSLGIAEGTRTFASIAELAAVHVEKIRSVQPHGPYRLAGFCFGGNLAAEVASQLADLGEEIELLFLLEASPPGIAADPGRWLRPGTWRRLISRLPERLRSLMARDTATALRRVKMKQRAAASRLGRDGVPDIRGVLDLDLLDPASQERAERHWIALHRHVPRLPRAGRIVLIRADDDGWLPRPPTLGWQAPGEIEVITVPGRHEEFLRQASAREVAEAMSQVL
jgi:amino acid adenylation domain-containing protein